MSQGKRAAAERGSWAEWAKYKLIALVLTEVPIQHGVPEGTWLSIWDVFQLPSYIFGDYIFGD